MTILNKPYPMSGGKKKNIIFCLIVGLFVFLFLFLFQPFGIHQWEINYKIWRLFGYGIVTMVVSFINSYLIFRIFPQVFKEENWKVWKDILMTLWNVVLIGAFNLLYSHFQGLCHLSFANFVFYQWITLLIAIFPVGILTILNYTRLQSKNMHEAQKITNVIESHTENIINKDSIEIITLKGENSNDELKMQIENLFFIVSADNYVEIVWNDNGQIQKSLLRNTLKNLEDSLAKHYHIFRCHRSYMVNLTKVTKVSGNSQGYKLHLLESEYIVPVSRSLNNSIRKKIEEIHYKN